MSTEIEYDDVISTIGTLQTVEPHHKYLPPSQVGSDYQYLSEYDPIQPIFHSWMGQNIHATINLCTLKTQPISRPSKLHYP